MTPEKIAPPSVELGGKPMEAPGIDAFASAAAILAQAGRLGDLRRRFGTWAPRQWVAETLDVHPDTLARAEKAGRVSSRIAVGPDRRCRVEVLLDDVAHAFGDRA